MGDGTSAVTHAGGNSRGILGELDALWHPHGIEDFL